VADFSKGQIGIVAIPLALIAILLPVAIVIGMNNDGGRDGIERPDEESTVAAVTAPAGADAVMTAVEMRWDQEEVTLRAGETLAVLNADNSTHNMTIGDENHGDIEPGQSRQWVAEEPGDYQLVCAHHPNFMKSTITVLEP